jgi:hypothetical protein
VASQQASHLEPLFNLMVSIALKHSMDEDMAIWYMQERVQQGAAHIQVADRYLQTYSALLDLGARTDITNTTQIRALACAAYGWMPRIVGPTLNGQLQQLSQNSNTFALLATPAAGAGFVEASLNYLLIGNSWVGSSKMLHVLKSEVFPSWGSKVASRFGLGYDFQVNNRGNYLQYIRFCADFLEAENCPDLVAWWQGDGANLNLPNNQAPTQLRILELILFS